MTHSGDTQRPGPTTAEQTVEAMVARMRAGGLKITPQRLAILKELAGDTSHPTAQELFDRLQPQLPTMSFATVYNTLASLAEAGLCLSRSLVPGAARFDPNTEPHDHAVCDRCGVVTDVEPIDREPRKAPRGFHIRAVERVYRGLCASCAPAELS